MKETYKSNLAKSNQLGFAVYGVFLVLFVIVIAGIAGLSLHTSANIRKTERQISATHKQSKNNNAPIKIVAAGDIACDPGFALFSGDNPHWCQQRKTADLIQELNPDYVLVLGDIQYEDGKYDKFLKGYDKSWGAFKDKTYPVPGNHEYLDKNASGYFRYFDRSKTGAPNKGYYAVKLGNWQVIGLNSNCKFIGGCDASSPQAAWLRGVMERSRATCTLSFWHHPQFTSGNFSDDIATRSLSSEFWRILTKYHGDVVLNGHDHIYERFGLQDGIGQASLQGMRQFTVGTGGKYLGYETAKQRNSEKFIDTKFGVLEMELYPNSYNWKFISTNHEVLDSGSQQCSTSEVRTELI